jgi:O-antigen/teichoic acid export membrane protein
MQNGRTDLKKQMAGALAWSFIDRMGQQVFQLVISLLLARLLAPADFGLVGILMVFCTLSYVLVDSGLVSALVRSKSVSNADYTAAFYFNLLVALVLYGVLFLSAPFIAAFFEQPQAVTPARVIFLAFIFSALYLVPLASLTRALSFKKIAIANVLSVALSGISGVCLALNGYGVWALVIQQIAYHLCRLMLLWGIVRWKPARDVSFSFIKENFSYSLNLLGVNVLNVLFNNIYVLLLGKFYPLKQVGYYTQANKLSETANFTIQSVLNNGIFPVLSKIQEETLRFARVLNELTKTIALFALPLMLLLIAVAEPLIVTLLTDKWAAAIPYFQLLCLANLFAPLYTLNINALNSRGKSEMTLRLEFFKKALITASLLLFPFGIQTMLGGYVIACTLAFALSLLLLKKELQLSFIQQVKTFIPTLTGAVVIALVVFSLSYFVENHIYLLVCELFSAIVLYILFVRVFFRPYYNRALLFLKSRF